MKEVAVVEDNEGIRDVIELVLQSDQYAVKMFSDVASFRLYMREYNPTVIVLDVMLPDGNGLDECRTLKSNHYTEQIPVILMSANIIPGTHEAGAAIFIGKPFDIMYFKEKVEYYLAGATSPIFR